MYPSLIGKLNVRANTNETRRQLFSLPRIVTSEAQQTFLAIFSVDEYMHKLQRLYTHRFLVNKPLTTLTLTGYRYCMSYIILCRLYEYYKKR